MTLIVTRARADDAAAFVDLSRQCAQEFADSQRFADAKVERMFAFMLDAGCILVAREGDQPVGFIAGIAVERWFSDELVVMPFAAYLLPRLRSGNAADMLLWEFQQWAVSRGAAGLEIIMLSGGYAETFASVAERAGFAPIGQAFGWRPGGAVSASGIDRH